VAPVSLLIIEGDFQPLEDPDLIIYLHVDDRIRLRNRIQRDMERRGATDVRAIVDNFNMRQQTQHLPYTLPVANAAHVLLCTEVVENESYRYDVLCNSLWKR